MHPLVRPVLLRTGRRDPLMDDPELHPPDAQRRQAVNRGRGEGRAVVGANRVRQSDGAKQRAKHRLDTGPANRGQRLTDQQHATVVIGDGQRITVAAIPGLELAFEVGRPDLIRVRRVSGALPGCVHDRRRRCRCSR